MPLVSRHQNLWLTITRFSVLWKLIKYFYLLWGILALTLKKVAYFPRSFHKLCTIYNIFPLTFLWKLKLLVFTKKTVCALCEEETKFLNKIWIHCKIKIGCNKFYYILRTVLLFVQNVILKDKNDHSKQFVTLLLLECARHWEKRKNATKQKECRKLPNRLSYLNRQKEKAFYFPTWFSTASADGTMRIDSTRYVKQVKRLHSNNMMPQQFGVRHL